jgi:DNA invertase Pin-like site-specific DNA recombinase
MRKEKGHANALVVHKDSLPLSQKALRAAQYVRMSTDLQKYSIENQAVVIATFAQLHHLTIVRTYHDEGESGLRIKSRLGLTQLIKDVQSASADYSHVLVFDVSRWGRFQDVDESAHYEFICKQAGIKVAYCAEQFDNDGSLISHIMKNIKRVMAAEFSRELSAKVYAGQSRLVRLGFKMGGPVGYGLQRLLVEQHTKLALKLVTLTFLRTTELRAGKWSELEDLDGKSAQWRVPAERMKMRLEHLVPLSRQAVAVLRELRALSGNSPNIFPSPGKEGCMSSNTMLYALYRMGYHGRATTHGFRGVASTILNESNLFNRDWIERQLAHVERNEVRRAYNAAEWMPDRRRMMQWWTDHITAMALEGDNIIPLSRAS